VNVTIWATTEGPGGAWSGTKLGTLTVDEDQEHFLTNQVVRFFAEDCQLFVESYTADPSKVAAQNETRRYVTHADIDCEDREARRCYDPRHLVIAGDDHLSPPSIHT
jgi:hypothetical protein